MRMTAADRNRTTPLSTRIMDPAPPSGKPAWRENNAPDSDWRATKRKTSCRSKRSKGSTQRLQNGHSPSKTTTE